MNVYQALTEHKEKLSLIGLGYVGMPIAVAFAKKLDVIGFDVNEKKSTCTAAAWTPRAKLETKP